MIENPAEKKKLPLKRILIIVVVVVLVIASAGGVWLFANKKTAILNTAKTAGENTDKKSSTVSTTADGNSTDPVTKGKSLSGGNCSGEGSKKLNSPPMRPSETSFIVPYGLLAGGHVTPIDHQYYWGKIPMGNPDSYDVLALSDGKIIAAQYRPHDTSKGYTTGKIKGDYRVVIMYSCTFYSYFDLATSLAPDIENQLPSGWEASNNKNVSANISIKEGQVIAKMGGQSLDFAVWDTTKFLKNLLVPIAYNNAEAWKINTVPPLDYFTDAVKKEILPLYLRTAEPRDGVIDQDVDGAAAGSWFQVGTNGYAGIFSYGSGGGGQNGYWSGQLALVHDLYDPNGWWFSDGDIGGQPLQFAIKNPSVLPDKLQISSGLVKYELAQGQHYDESGNQWIGDKPGLPKGSLSLRADTSKGVVLVQLLEKRKLKVEVFMDKTPNQVSAFTSAAKIYDRGDNAKMVESNTAH